MNRSWFFGEQKMVLLWSCLLQNPSFETLFKEIMLMYKIAYKSAPIEKSSSLIVLEFETK